jgi:hypothetical protein
MPSEDDLDPWLRVRLEDYKSAWSEVLASMSQQQSVLSFGAAAEAVVAAAIGSQWRHLAPFAFLTLVVAPGLGLLIIAIWATEVGRMRRAAQYVASIEIQVAAVFKPKQAPPMQFMNWRNANRMPWAYKAVIGAFLPLAIGVLAVGLVRSDLHWWVKLLAGLANAVVLAVAVFLIVFASRKFPINESSMHVRTADLTSLARPPAQVLEQKDAAASSPARTEP